MDWTHAVIKIILTLYRIVDGVLILNIKRLSSNAFFLAEVQLSTRESIRVYHVSKMFPCRLKKYKPSFLLLLFFWFHWRTKTNRLIYRRSTNIRSQTYVESLQKISRKELPTFNPQFTIKRTIEIANALAGNSLASRAQAMPAKQLRRQKRHKNTFC